MARVCTRSSRRAASAVADVPLLCDRSCSHCRRSALVHTIGVSKMRLPMEAWLLTTVLLTLSWTSTGRAEQVVATASSPERIIIDTDIGIDIDDAFAVALALQSPEVKILGVSTDSGDTVARAKIVDRVLGETGHSDIPVAVGTPTTLPFDLPPIGRQGRFGENSRFAKATHPSAVEFILEQIRRFPGQVTLVTIGPVTNVGELIAKDPQVFRGLKRVVMMGGSIGPLDMDGFGTTKGPRSEYNIMGDIPAAQKLFQSGVPIYLMPLDSTAQLRMDEVKRDILLSKGTPLTDALAVLYFMWGGVTPRLPDAMAVAYVVNPELCPVQPMHIVVDDKGVTRAVPGKPNAQVCLHSDPERFFHFYMARF